MQESTIKQNAKIMKNIKDTWKTDINEKNYPLQFVQATLPTNHLKSLIKLKPRRKLHHPECNNNIDEDEHFKL